MIILIKYFLKKLYNFIEKLENINHIFLNELNRLCWGQSIRLIKKYVKKILLMTYHQEYGVNIQKVINITKKLNVFHNTNKIHCIWQTYQDNPIVNYDINWKEVNILSSYFDDNTYFRFGCCNLETFK